MHRCAYFAQRVSTQARPVPPHWEIAPTAGQASTHEVLELRLLSTVSNVLPENHLESGAQIRPSIASSAAQEHIPLTVLKSAYVARLTVSLPSEVARAGVKLDTRDLTV